MSTLVTTPLKRRGNDNHVTGSTGKPLLIIVEGQDISPMINAGLQALGGIERILGPHKKILIKPNTNQRDPFPSTTDPAAMRAVANQCFEAGVEEIIVHEDHKSELDLYFEPETLPGMKIELSHSPTAEHYVAVEHEPWHGDGDADPVVEYSHMERRGMVARLLDGEFEKTEGPRLRVAKQIQEAPIVINMPVLKRHFAGQITSALKNHFGSVYGPQRWLAHLALNTNRDYFDRKLAEFASAIRPELTITDARSLQAVSGPGRGDDTRIVNDVNRIIITSDMIAADVVAMDLMNQYDDTFTEENRMILAKQHRHAEELGLGTSDLNKFEIIEVSA
jgi:uncharacterized protein (DUF362 family)